MPVVTARSHQKNMKTRKTSDTIWLDPIALLELFGLTMHRILTAVLILAFTRVASADQLYDLRVYTFKTADHAAKFDGMMKNAAIPGLGRIGVKQIGVFKEMKPKDDVIRRYSLIAFDSFETYSTWIDQLGEDNDAIQAAMEYLSAEKSDPAFVRIESSLFKAFSGMPKLKVPKADDSDAKRMFELRMYESHSEYKGRMKVAMFNDGEIDIFNKVGLRAVFYGEALAAPNLPQLTYMLVHENQEAKDKAWKAFLGSPDWEAMKGQEQYKDTVSKIVMTMLTPMDYSPIR